MSSAAIFVWHFKGLSCIYFCLTLCVWLNFYQTNEAFASWIRAAKSARTPRDDINVISCMQYFNTCHLLTIALHAKILFQANI